MQFTNLPEQPVFLDDGNASSLIYWPMPTDSLVDASSDTMDWYNQHYVDSRTSDIDDICQSSDWGTLTSANSSEPEDKPGIIDDFVGRSTPSSSRPTTCSTDESVYLTPDQLSWGEASVSQSSVKSSTESFEERPATQQIYERRFVAIAPKDPASQGNITSQLQKSPTTAIYHPKSRRPGRGRKRLPPDQLKTEIRRVQKPVKCAFCNKGFEYKKGQTRHYVVYHKKQALEQGLLTEADAQKTSCPLCPTEFARPDYLAKHMRNKHAHAFESGRTRL